MSCPSPLSCIFELLILTAGMEGAAYREIWHSKNYIPSIHTVFFPFGGSASQIIVRGLIAKGGFDPDCRHSAIATYSRPNEVGCKFRFWGGLLMGLYEEVDNPAPRGFLDRRL